VHPYETFRSTNPAFSIAVFRKTTSAEQSTSCISYIESSVKGTASSVSESDGVSDGVGCRQTLLFRLFEGIRTALDASRLVLDLAAFLFSFSELPQQFFL
jgi:hypothetical protein